MMILVKTDLKTRNANGDKNVFFLIIKKLREGSRRYKLLGAG